MSKWVMIAAAGFMLTMTEQRASAAPPAGIPGIVALEQRPALRTEMDSFPRVTPNAEVTPAVAARINALLARLDKAVLANAKFCRKVRRGMEDADDWTRTVSVTMRGPHYLSLLAEDSYSCGAPHPLDDRTALVFDLTTGSPVNWTRLLPPGASGEITRDTHGIVFGFVKWPMLLRKEQQAAGQAAVKDTDDECTSVFAPEHAADLQFMVWLDAGQESVMFAPVGLVHYDSAMCGDPVAIGVKEARQLGLASKLLDALSEAKRLP